MYLFALYLVKCSLNNGLTLSIEGRRGFIQQKDFGVTDESSSNRNPLLLSSTQLSPSVPDQRLKLLLNDNSLSISRLWREFLKTMENGES